MSYRVITVPTVEPITLEDARVHLRIEGFGSPPTHPDDDYIQNAIQSAREWCEQYLERSLSTQTVEYATANFNKPIFLPSSPVQSVESIKYIDTDGTQQTLSETIYELDPFSNEILRKFGQRFPAVREGKNSVIVTYVAGYTNGESPDLIPLPKPIRSAMLLIIGNAYENRQEDVLGNTRISFNSLPLGVYNLLQPYRLGLGL